MNGPVEIMLFQTRDGLFQARVTMTDPTAPATPYVVPPQIVRTTKPNQGLYDAMCDVSRLIETVKGYE